MNVLKTDIEGVLIVEPRVFKDGRGHFMETYHRERYVEAGIDEVFVQDNLSVSSRGTLRGLHYQITRSQAKLVQVGLGRIFDVAVDIRAGSPTFGKWVGVELSAENNRQLFIPKGFAHGFSVVSETAHMMYKCSDLYAPGDEGGIIWSDPDVGIQWPVSDAPLLSPKDQSYPCLKDVPADCLPMLAKD